MRVPCKEGNRGKTPDLPVQHRESSLQGSQPMQNFGSSPSTTLGGIQHPNFDLGTWNLANSSPEDAQNYSDAIFTEIFENGTFKI